MIFEDFEYDGLRLSSMGYTVCDFENSDIQSVSNGSKLTFDTVPIMNGNKHYLINGRYDECLEITFDICKISCFNDISEITLRELRTLMSWLNRKDFHKLKILNDNYMDLYFNASFNISKIEIDGKLYGLSLTATTDAPFAYNEPAVYSFIGKDGINNFKTIYDSSDEEGYIYPKMTITVKEEGDLVIQNSLENGKETVIKNCLYNEVITLDYPTVTSTEKNIQDRFNWHFPKIINTFKNKKNDLSFSKVSEIRLEYSPIAKILV